MSSQETEQEILHRLERSYNERYRILIDLKDQLCKLQDQVLAASDSAFKSFQTLSNAKEQFLVNIVGTQNQQLKKLTAPVIRIVSQSLGDLNINTQPPLCLTPPLPSDMTIAVNTDDAKHLTTLPTILEDAPIL